MTTSAIDRELIYYFMQLDDQQKRSLLEMIKTFLKPADKQPSGISIEEYSNELGSPYNNEIHSRLAFGENLM